MNKFYSIVLFLTVTAYAQAQHEGHVHGEQCSHDSTVEQVPHDHDGDGIPDHDSHDHKTQEDHAGHDHGGHNHGEGGCSHDDHAGHDHAGHEHGSEDGGLEISEEMARKVGIKLGEATGGLISSTVVFPAEIKLNRDRSASVSARYSSVVRQVFVEIGDEVKKGDILASLENRDTLAVYTVAAPLDGVVINKGTAVGETAGEYKVLFEVADLSSVWADISIFPQFQHFIRKGMPVEFIAHDGHTATGKVKFVSPIVSEETRTFTARSVLNGADEDFTPGAFVRARMTIGQEVVSVRIEKNAVQVLEGEPMVFVPAEHGYESREVTLGISDQNYVEILSGLKKGEQYVSSGAFALKAEMVTSGLDPHAGHGH